MNEQEEILDDDIKWIEESIWPVIIKYSVWGSIALFGIGIFHLLISLVVETPAFLLVFFVFAMLFNFGTYITTMTLAALKYRKINMGFATFGKTFAITFCTGLFMAITSVLIMALLFFLFEQFFDGGDVLSSDDDLDASASMNLVLVLSSYSSFFIGFIPGVILSLILGFIIKKDRPRGFSVN